MCEQRSMCQRCGCIIIDGRVLRIAAASIGRPEVSLCSGCGDLLSDWLAGGKDDPDAIPADLDPPPDWPPLAGRSATPRDFASGAAS